jgi:hypothetical protein
VSPIDQQRRTNIHQQLNKSICTKQDFVLQYLRIIVVILFSLFLKLTLSFFVEDWPEVDYVRQDL